MIDSIIVPPAVHLSIGTLVLLSNTLALIVCGWLAFKKRPLTKLANALLILFQLVLMLQVLIGVKLLDQGLGVLQLYIHYLGGLAPLFFCLLFYWSSVGKDALTQSRRMTVVMAASLFFVVLTFAVGSMYVAEGTSATAESATAESATAESATAEKIVKSDGAGDPEKGAALYIACSGCHGADGQGVNGVGVALTANTFIQTHSDQALVDFIEQGRAAGAPDNRSGVIMPPKGGNSSLTEQNLYDIVAFLRTLEGNRK